jgi:membrane protein YdbS with pleckstrin-like domain
MDALTWFGVCAVGAMMVCYALEERSAWFVLSFAGACVLASAIWAVIALRRWRIRLKPG